MAGRKKAQTKELKSAASAYEQSSRKRQATSAKKGTPSKPARVVAAATRVSTVQEQPPHPRPALHPGVVNNADATAEAHQVAVNTVTGRSAHTAATAASQAGLTGVAATGEVSNLQPISAEIGIPAERGAEVGSAQPLPAPIQGEAVLQAIGSLRAEATVVRGPVGTELDAVEDLFTQIGGTITSLLALPVPAGDNQAPERNAAVRDFEVFIRSGTLTVHVVRGQVQSADPNPVVVEQNVSAFQTVRVGVSWFREHFLAGMVRHIGATAAGHLLRQLDRQISELSHRLPEVIALIGHWAHLAGH